MTYTQRLKQVSGNDIERLETLGRSIQVIAPMEDPNVIE